MLLSVEISSDRSGLREKTALTLFLFAWNPGEDLLDDVELPSKEGFSHVRGAEENKLRGNKKSIDTETTPKQTGLAL